ncbi:flagellin [Marinobacter sp. AL4B]|uniref:flagellin N-terminal helical domain-containing protein n=1 Tax=Marinobacter sp. AL4B TaxID=2871173 RepID=UPI001CAA7B3A|nr:flagellin [Marinobacter sp. AL4B]MBZ0333231.1 flagellin [Marinobacter sp. AL4B]
MPQVINTNMASLNAQRNLNASQSQANTALERLSSGLRINSAKDDAAGLAISERFQSQISGLNIAQRNANDGISLAQTAEGAMDEITNNLQRIRELAVQSANATNSVSDRQALNQEVQQRIEEINRIASQTSFNGLKVLDGTFDTQTFQVGANTGETISVSGLDSRGSQIGGTVEQTSVFGNRALDPGVFSVNTSTLDFDSSSGVSTNGTGLTISSATNPSLATLEIKGAKNIDEAVAQLQTQISQNQELEGLSVEQDDTGFRFVNNTSVGLSIAGSLTDGTGNTGANTGPFSANVATTVHEHFKDGKTIDFEVDIDGAKIPVEGATSLNDIVAKVNARTNETGIKANLDSTNDNIVFSSQFGEPFTIGITADTNGDATNNIDFKVFGTADSDTVSMNEIDISTREGADLAMIAVDYAIDTINGYRAELGAVQNRFESTIANLSTTSENLSASNSRIRDADFAAETAELARTQVLQSAGLSVLAQANARPQQVLQLLQG